MRSNSAASFVLAGTFALAAPVWSDAAATLVRDIGTTVPRTIQNYWSGPGLTVLLDGVAYFHFDDGIHGRELWRTDGTAAGTRLLADLCPGSCGAASFGSWRAIAATSEAVYFAASDGVHGVELWATDGTLAGTRLVRDVRKGLLGSEPDALTAVGDRVYFDADDGEHGSELWVSDGTASGTLLVADLNPGVAGTFVEAALALDGDLVFGAWFQFQGGNGLWRSDGTSGGTFQLTTAQPTNQNWIANSPIVTLGDRLLFVDSDGGGLWVSDGSPGGTFEIGAFDFPEGFVPFGGFVYFQHRLGSQDQLIRTDGTAAGTTEVALPEPLRLHLRTGSAVATPSRLYFAASDAAHGAEPWTTDGVSVARVADIRPGPDSSLGQAFFPASPQFGALDDLALFFADDGIHGRELWRSNGTAAGTSLVRDLTVGAAGTSSEWWTDLLPAVVVDGALLFRSANPDDVTVLWRSDSTAAGTQSLAKLDPSTSSFLPSVPELRIGLNRPAESCFAPLRDGLFVAARDGSLNSDPWFSDGTAAGTYRVLDWPDGDAMIEPHACRPLADRAIFSASLSPSDEYGLHSTDGEPGDLETLSTTAGTFWLDGTVVVDRRLFVAGRGGLWSTDGTASGTEFVGSGYGFEPGLVGRFGERVTLADGELFAFSPASPEAGLQPIADLNGGEASWPLRTAELDDRLLFLAYTAETGLELWSTNGDPAEVELVRDLRPGPANGIVEVTWTETFPLLTRLVLLGDRIVFSADDGIVGEELWTTDGTTGGTTLLADLHPGAYPSSPRELTLVDDAVYFVAETPAHGRELWRTNGLPSGTQLVVDLVPGPGSSMPQELAAAGSDLYFSAWTPESGREPWRIRTGASSGPAVARLADVAPGPLSSSPLAFLEIGGRVFFPANDNLLGFELWSVQEPDSIFSDGFESSGTAVWSTEAR